MLSVKRFLFILPCVDSWRELSTFADFSFIFWYFIKLWLTELFTDWLQWFQRSELVLYCLESGAETSASRFLPLGLSPLHSYLLLGLFSQSVAFNGTDAAGFGFLADVTSAC